MIGLLLLLFSVTRLWGGRPAVSGPGVGVAVVTQPGALPAIMPGPGTTAGDTVPPPVTIFGTHEHFSSQHTLLARTEH